MKTCFCDKNLSVSSVLDSWLPILCLWLIPPPSSIICLGIVIILPKNQNLFVAWISIFWTNSLYTFNYIWGKIVQHTEFCFWIPFWFPFLSLVFLRILFSIIHQEYKLDDCSISDVLLWAVTVVSASMFK